MSGVNRASIVTAQRRRIGILLFDGVKMLDYVGPAEVFVEANQAVGGYEIVLLSADGGDVATSVGGKVSVHAAAADAGVFDTVIVPGSEQPPEIFARGALLDAARGLAGRTRRLVSICSGAFVLAILGELDGHRATTHWKFTKDLARRFPEVLVQPDSIFVRDGRVYTSAGVAAGIDLALSLVEEDHGADVARQVAQLLLVYMHRSGGQSQFSASLRAPAPRTRIVRQITDLIEADPARPYSVGELAKEANVSVRHLTRLFRDELDSSPAEYVGALRFDMARIQLEAGASVTAVAAAAGFGSTEALRRTFIARLGISPSKYQQRFRTTQAASRAAVN
jgi:transcriptional regulator GlxA family with amidase domain